MLDQYLTIIVILLILSQVVLVLAYFPIFKLVRKFRHKEFHAEDEAIKEAERILEEARQTAKQQISSSLNFSSDLKDNYRDSLALLSRELLNDFQKDFLLWGNESKDSLKTITSRMDETTAEFLQTFKTDLTEQSRLAIAKVDEAILAEITATQEELNSYKKGYIKKLAGKSEEIVLEVVKESLHKNLTLADHQSLVETALTKIDFDKTSNAS